MRRRDFLGVAVAFGSAFSARAANARLFACNSWPFRTYFDTPLMHQYRDPKLPLVTQEDFPEFLADHFDIHNVEFLPQHFSSTEPGTIQKIKQALQKANSRCCNLMGVDLRTMTENAELWANIAATLGSPTITVALTGPGTVDVNNVVTSLKPALELVNRRGLKLLFHNDDIRRESAEILTAIIQQLGPTKAGTCPDFGNFAPRSRQFALAQLKMLAPYASNICHAKDGIAEKGTFYPDDFAASMRVMQQAGFQGVYSMEFEGLGDPIAGVKHLMELTGQHLG
jgi:sugar phosphate isomerase/epimerase